MSGGFGGFGGFGGVPPPPFRDSSSPEESEENENSENEGFSTFRFPHPPRPTPSAASLMPSQTLPSSAAGNSIESVDSAENLRDDGEGKGDAKEGKTENSPPAPSSSAPSENPFGLSFQMDFRRGKLPAGVRIIGDGEIIPQNDGATFLRLSPNASLKIDFPNKFTPNGPFGVKSRHLNDFSVILDIRMESLPKEGMSLFQCKSDPEKGVGTEGEAFVYRSGGVGAFGEYGSSANWIRPNKWTRIVVTMGGPPTARKMTTYVNSKICANITKGVFNSADGRFAALPEGIYLFSSIKSLFQPGCDVKFCEFVPRCLSPSTVFEFSGSNRIFSYWEEMKKDEMKKRFEGLSLQSLYKRPPAVFQHPAFLAEFGDAFLEGLVGGTIPPSLAVIDLAFRAMRTEQTDYFNGLSESDLAVVDSVGETLKEAAELGKKFSLAVKNPSQLMHFMRHFRGKIEGIKEGEFLMVPGGIGGFPLLYLLERTTATKFNLTVCNTSPYGGLQFHPVKGDRPNRLLYKTSLLIPDVPIERILDDAFWAFAFKLFVVKSKKNTPDKLYSLLLPFLVQRPLEEILSATRAESAIEWRTPERATTGFHRCILEGMNFIMRRRGIPKGAVKLLSFTLRLQFVSMLENDLQYLTEIADSDRRIIQLATQQIAYTAVKLNTEEEGGEGDESKEQKNPPSPYSLRNDQLEKIYEWISQIDCLVLSLPCEDSPAISPPPPLDLVIGDKIGETAKGGPQWSAHPFGDRLRRKDDVSGLAGLPIRLPPYVPVDALQLPRKVTTLVEAVAAIRHCDRLCTLISVQGHFIKYPNQLKVSLMEFVFLSLLPVPCRMDSPTEEKSIWGTPMTYPQQLDILITSQRLIEHFASSVFSLLHTKAFDAIRLVVPAVISAICDRVMRHRATDIPSDVSLNYGGHLGLPPFGPSMGKFSEQCEVMEIHTAEVAVARTLVLDYFDSLGVPEENEIFQWETALSAESSLNSFFSQVCERLAFPLNDIPCYLSGEQHLILKNYPEFLCFRDILFYWKFLQNSESESFPPMGEWTQKHAQLKWVFNEGAYIVEAYGRFECHCKPQKSAWGIRFPSFANPSKLCDPHAVKTEDDVLHIKNLPNFENAIGQRDSELLISYLTVPYLRIPLVLSFFSSEDRIHSLKSKDLQNVLDSVLFEPGRFLPKGLSATPQMVPTTDKKLLSTPLGHLICEFIHSPEGITDSVCKLLKLSLDLDVGTFKSSTVDIILFVVRMATKMENFLHYIKLFAEGTHQTIPYAEIRGIRVTPSVLSLLNTAISEIRRLLRGPVHRMLEEYIEEAMRAANAEEGLTKRNDEKLDENTKMACTLHAHLILMYRNVPLSELSADIVSQLLCSFVFLNTRHTWNLGVLPVAENSVMECLQSMRRPLIEWLRERPGQLALNDLMDSVVRVATTTGIRKDEKSELSDGDELPPTSPSTSPSPPPSLPLVRARSQRDGDVTRRWGFVGPTAPTNRSVGRFTVASTRRNHLTREESKMSIPIVETSEQMGIEIDLGISQLTLKSSHLKALDSNIANDEDVTLIFGKQSMQAATIQSAEHRDWVRLVGRNHDLHFWKTADPRPEILNFDREYQPGELSPSESWIVPIFEPIRLTYMVRPFVLQIVMPEESLHKDADVAVLVAIHPKKGGAWKEIVVHRHLRVVHVYNILSHGRRFYRSLEYTSDARQCLRELQPSSDDREYPWPKWGRYEAGGVYNEYPNPLSVVITRHADIPNNRSGTEETFIPSRLLFGVVPQSLLDSHTFWQDEKDNLRGYPIDDSPHIIFIEWADQREIRSTRQSGVSLKIRRLPLAMIGNNGEILPPPASSDGRAKTMDEEELILLNTLYAPVGTKLHSLAQCLLRIEHLSFILVWTVPKKSADSLKANGAIDDSHEFSIDFVEFPRLKISFSTKLDEKGIPRLYSMDHSNLFVSNERSQLTTKLMTGIPHSLLLANSNGEMNILVPSIRPIRPLIATAPFSCELVLQRNEKEWMDNLDTKYYLYPVHVSLSFLFTPTLSSALYLLFLRFLHRQYDETFRLAVTIANDTAMSPEEKMIFKALGDPVDGHPNAHACRLKISSVTIDSPVDVPWDLTKEMSRWILKIQHVAATCRLDVKEEFQLISKCICDVSDPRFDPKIYSEYEITVVKNRLHYLSALMNGEGTAKCFIPERWVGSPWPYHNDLSAFAASPSDWQSLTVHFSASPLLSGVMALDVVHQFWNGMETTSGDVLKLGFLFLYGLFTGTNKIKFGTNDDSHSTAVLLTQLLSDGNDPSLMSSILHILGRNREICQRLPKFQDKRQFKNETLTGFIGDNENSSPLDDLFSALIPSLQSLMDSVRKVPSDFPRLPLPPSTLTVRPPSGRSWILPAISNFSEGKRILSAVDSATLPDAPSSSNLGFSPDALKVFSTAPLSPLDFGRFVTFQSRADRSLPPVVGVLPFDVSAHPQTKSEVAKSMIHRLHGDSQVFAERENKGKAAKLIKFLDNEIRAFFTENSAKSVDGAIELTEILTKALENLRDSDALYVNAAIPFVVHSANSIPTDDKNPKENARRIRFLLQRYCGQESHLWLDFVIGALLSNKSEEDIAKVNPFIPKDSLKNIFDVVVATILHANRVGMANRTISDCRELKDLLTAAKEAKGKGVISDLLAGIQQKSEMVARGLTTERHFIEQSDGIFTYDPRFLVFEFTWNIVLRKMQVLLVRDFIQQIREGKSAVKQMIMGQGKTTVVAPLLALMLGNGDRLVCQVVPPALLEFSRSVMRSTFSSIMYKRIYTLNVERATPIDGKLFAKLSNAVESSGVVISTPTSVKSLMLKFLETLDVLNTPSRPRDPSMVVDVAELQKILRLFRHGVLLVDEVDLVLHPLKSELNFPIGEKVDLDFNPLRWKLPIHLIDAIFFAERGRMSVGFTESNRAVGILDRLRATISRGYEERALQRNPHIVLLNVDFYHSSLKPILFDWLLLFLESQHLAGLSEDSLREYIVDRHQDGENPKLSEAVNALPPKFRKLLNLSRDWLSSFLPHVLAKIDRVTFGLLTKEDAERAKSVDPNMPASRMKLAVPFIGKDVPSRSSEFAHPDIILGLSILAYRYEGLRESDFHDVISTLRATLSKEIGPFNERKSSLRYDKWVKLAGGRVKGQSNFSEKTDGSVEVIPLRLLKRSNEEQMDTLFKLLFKLPELIHWYLTEFIFPAHMRHQIVKLSASGQELGGSVLFPQQIGFSGTPSDLLPIALGRCGYEAGSDGQIVSVLTDPSIVSFEEISEGWGVKSLLKRIASANPPFNALIDTGALITGMGNFEVAKFLLDNGLHGIDGVVFLDEFDRKMILVRATGRVLKLAQCGIPPSKRFAFYDQIHTTGMDISHGLSACAVVTLGKDMTFRDFAQGAYRMRGIGKGQTIRLFIIPEVSQLIGRELRAAGNEKKSNAEGNRQTLLDVSAWLVINSCRSERVQFNMLCLQNLQNVWRKTAFQTLLSESSQFTISPIPGEITADSHCQKCLALFKEPIEFTIESAVPKPRLFTDTVDGLSEKYKEFLYGDAERKVVETVRQTVRGIVDDDLERTFDGEQVKEQEQEQEQQQEQEQEQEIEIEKYVDAAYSREHEEPTPWPFVSLKNSNPQDASQFYPLREFHLYKRNPMEFPPFLLVSSNYFDKRWSGARRVKNTVIVMEWTPSPEECRAMTPRSFDVSALSESQRVALQKAVDLFDADGSGDLNRLEISALLKGAMDFKPEEKQIDEILSEFADSQKGSALSLPAVLKILNGGTFRSEVSGKYFVALSLGEAETVRRILHSRLEKFPIEGSQCSVALRCVPTGFSVIDASVNWGKQKESHGWQSESSLQSFRFFDSDLFYSDPQINVLLRSLSASSLRERQLFFHHLSGCRRRMTRRPEETPLAKFFSLPSEFHFLKQRAMAARTKAAITQRGLLLYDAFRLFDFDRNGLLSPSELWGSLEWLGISLSPTDILEFVETADADRDGNLNYREFAESLRESDAKIDDIERESESNESGGGSLGVSASSPSVSSRIPPKGEDSLEALRQKKLSDDKKFEEDEMKRAEAEEMKIQREIQREEEENDKKQQGGPNPQIDNSSVRWDFSTGRRPRLLKTTGDFAYKTEGSRHYFKVYKQSSLQVDVPFCAVIASNEFTVTAEVKFDAMPTGAVNFPLIAFPHGAHGKSKGNTAGAIVFRADGAVGFDGQFATSQKLRKDRWAILTVSVNLRTGNIAFFIDGKVSGTFSLPTELSVNGKFSLEGRLDLFFGSSPADSLGGNLRLLMVREGALSAGDVAALYDTILQEGSWQCDNCTAINLANSSRCSVCDSVRGIIPSGGSGISSGGGDGNPWSCVACSFLNEGNTTKCSICETIKQ